MLFYSPTYPSSFVLRCIQATFIFGVIEHASPALVVMKNFRSRRYAVLQRGGLPATKRGNATP